MIAMKMMKSLISRLRFCFLKTNILVNTDVYFATTKKKNKNTFNKCLKISDSIARKEITKQKRLSFISLGMIHIWRP